VNAAHDLVNCERFTGLFGGTVDQFLMLNGKEIGTVL
jgi:hypothetical protein